MEKPTPKKTVKVPLITVARPKKTGTNISTDTTAVAKAEKLVKLMKEQKKVVKKLEKLNPVEEAAGVPMKDWLEDADFLAALSPEQQQILQHTTPLLREQLIQVSSTQLMLGTVTMYKVDIEQQKKKRKKASKLYYKVRSAIGLQTKDKHDLNDIELTMLDLGYYIGLAEEEFNIK